MNEFTEVKIWLKNEVRKTYMNNGIIQNCYDRLLELIFYSFCLTEKLQNDHHDHFIKKLGSLNYATKTLRSIWKPFYHGKNIPLIPPLVHGNKIISEFQGKANLFNTFFTSQCTLFSNDNNQELL